MKLVLAAFCLSSCALAGDVRALATACGPDSARFDVTRSEGPAPVANNDARKARIYVITDGAPQTARIGLDGAWVGAAHGNSWFSFLAEPRERHLCADWQPSKARTMSLRSPDQTTSLANFTAEAGKTYYFRVRWTMRPGDTVSSFDLWPTNSDEGQFLVGAYPLSTPKLRN